MADGRLKRPAGRPERSARNADLGCLPRLGGAARFKIGGGSSKPGGVDHTPSGFRLGQVLESEGMVEKVRTSSCLPADAQPQLGGARGWTGGGGSGCKQPHCSCLSPSRTLSCCPSRWSCAALMRPWALSRRSSSWARCWARGTMRRSSSAKKKRPDTCGQSR